MSLSNDIFIQLLNIIPYLFMSPNKSKKGLKNVLIALGVFFLVLCVISETLFDSFYYRLTRVLICFTFFGLMVALNRSKTNPYLAGFLLIYGLSGVLILWYENHILATLSMFLNFLAYACFTRTLFPKVDFKKMNLSFSIIFIILVLVNIYLLYMFIGMIKGFTMTTAHYLFILLFAVSFVSAGFFTLLYNHTYSSKTTFTFTLGVYFIIFSEIFSAIGYYDLGLGSIAFHVSRAMLIAGAAVLVYYQVLNKPEKELLYSKLT